MTLKYGRESDTDWSVYNLSLTTNFVVKTQGANFPTINLGRSVLDTGRLQHILVKKLRLGANFNYRMCNIIRQQITMYTLYMCNLYKFNLDKIINKNNNWVYWLDNKNKGSSLVALKTFVKKKCKDKINISKI